MADNVERFYQIGDRYTSRDTINHQNFTVLDFSRKRSLIKRNTELHTHGFLEIFIFERGHGIVTAGSKVFDCKKPSVLIIDAGTPHRQYSLCEDNPLTYYNFTVDALKLAGHKPNCLASAVNGNSDCGYYMADVAPDNVVYSIIQDIIRELEYKSAGYKLKVYGYFFLLFTEIVRLMPLDARSTYRKTQGAVEDALLSTKKYIEEHYTEDLTLEMLANRVFISKSYLLHQFKNIFAVSPMQYLKLTRIRNAKKLLAASDKSITEIAIIVGFNNSAYFSKTFLKTIGTTPSSYRQLVNMEE